MTTPPPSSHFLVQVLKYCRHKILDNPSPLRAWRHLWTAPPYKDENCCVCRNYSSKCETNELSSSKFLTKKYIRSPLGWNVWKINCNVTLKRHGIKLVHWTEKWVIYCVYCRFRRYHSKKCDINIFGPLGGVLCLCQ